MANGYLLNDRREKNKRLIREAIHVRYMLLPYFYTLFREANTTGLPVMRPLWMEFPSDEATFSNEEAFMVGSSLLVQGIYTEVLLPPKPLHIFDCSMPSLYFIFSSTSAPQIKISMVFFLSRGQNMHLFTCQGKNYGMTLELEMHTREVKRISWRLQRVFLLSKGLELLFPGKTGFVEAQHRW
jgi:hypothetical protein